MNSDNKITMVLSVKLSTKFNNSPKENKGQCQRYNEYEIKPKPTKNLLDKILVIIFLSFEYQIIIAVPNTGTRVINDGCKLALSK